MVRNRSNLGFFIMHRTDKVIENKYNLTVVLNSRKRLTLKLYEQASTTNTNPLRNSVTTYLRKKVCLKKTYFNIYYPYTLYYDSFSLSNQFFTVKSPKGYLYAKNNKLNFWLNNFKVNSLIVFYNKYLFNLNLNTLLEKPFYNTWFYSWKFKFYRTLNQTPTLIFNLFQKTLNAGNTSNHFFFRTFNLNYRRQVKYTKLTDCLPAKFEEPEFKIRYRFNKNHLVTENQSKYTHFKYIFFIKNTLRVLTSLRQLFIFKIIQLHFCV
jgi:hypothetical protein